MIRREFHLRRLLLDFIPRINHFIFKEQNFPIVKDQMTDDEVRKLFLDHKIDGEDVIIYINGSENVHFEFVEWFIRNHAPDHFLPKIYIDWCLGSTFEKIYNLLKDTKHTKNTNNYVRSYSIYKSVKNPKEKFYKTKLQKMGFNVFKYKYSINSHHYTSNINVILMFKRLAC